MSSCRRSRVHLAKSIVALFCAGYVSIIQAQAVTKSGDGGQGTQIADDSQIPEIVVTARKRAENLETTPIAVTAISGVELEQSSIRNIRDLSLEVPSFQAIAPNYTTTGDFYYIRGQGVQDINLFQTLAVAVYVDGVYLPHAIGADANEFLDIRQVEVLEGPQGTLFGRGSTGGAVTFATNDPTPDFEGYLRGRIGNYGDRAITAVVNLPLSDTLGLRLAGSSMDRTGYGINSYDGQKFGARDGNQLRATLAWEPDNNFKVTLRGDVASSNSSAMGQKALWFDPAGAYVFNAQASAGLPTPAAALALLQSYQKGNFWDANLNTQPDEKNTSWGYSVTVELNLPEGLKVKSITAQRGFDSLRDVDLDASPFSGFAYDNYHIADNQFSEELQLLGTEFDQRLQWITGLYYLSEQGDEQGPQTIISAINPANPSVEQGTVRNDTAAVFAQASFDLTHNWSVTLGGRYTSDYRFLDSQNHNIGLGICTSLGVPYTTPEACNRDLSHNWGAYTYTADLEYKFDSERMMYFRTSRGFRSGGLPYGGGGNTPAEAAATFAPFQPEYVTDYELGLKAEWFDHRLRTNIDAFRSNYTNIQSTHAVVVPGVGVVSLVTNAAGGVVKGAEAWVTAVPIPKLELSLSASYLDAYYTSGVPPIPGFGPTPFTWTPKWQYSAVAAYTSTLPYGSLRDQLDWSWVAKQYPNAPASALTGLNYDALPSRGLLNGRITWASPDSKLEVAVYSRNLTDKKYYSYITDLYVLGAVIGTVGTPRTYGLEITNKF